MFGLSVSVIYIAKFCVQHCKIVFGKGKGWNKNHHSHICPCSYLVHWFRCWTLHREPTLSSQILHLTLWCFPEQREKKKTLIVGMTVENDHKYLEFCSALLISLDVSVWPLPPLASWGSVSTQWWDLPSVTHSSVGPLKFPLIPQRCASFPSQVSLVSMLAW